MKGGRAHGRKPSDFDTKELRMGISEEMEHTDDLRIAKQIAMDHLVDIPDYYTRLKRMEKTAKKDRNRLSLRDRLK